MRFLACPARFERCLLYTSDAADEEDSVDLGGRRIIKKGKIQIGEGSSDLAISPLPAFV